MTQMRIFNIRRLLLFLIAFFLFTSTADALVRIQGDQDGQARITIKLVDIDDANDSDQTVTDPDKAIIQIENRLRRYIGVYIDRNINGSSEYYEVVDNGLNDEIIDPASEFFSFGTLQDFIDCIWGSGGKATLAPSSRRYILPIARGQSGEVTPGMENRFHVGIVGPSRPEPLPPYWDLASSRAELAWKATLWTVGLLYVMPVLDLAVPELKMEDKRRQAILSDFVNTFKQAPSFITCFSQEDIWACIEAAVKKLLESQSMSDWLKSEGVQQELNELIMSNEAGAILSKIYDFAQGLLMRVATATDLANALLQLHFGPWEEVFEVLIIRPRVDSIEPNTAQVGEQVTIRGAGFDTYNISNNLVLFTDVTYASREAKIVSVPDENTILVEVPDGDLDGPVVVWDTALAGILEKCCSNDDVSFVGFSAYTLCITSPEDGATVGEWTDIVVELKDLPEDAFDYGDLVAELFVDGVKQTDKYVDSSFFSFLDFNTGSLTTGTHTIEVRLAISGRTIRDSIVVVVPADTDFPRTYRGSLSTGFGVYAKTRPIEIVLEDREHEKLGDVQYYTLVLTCKFKLKKGPQFEDTEEEQHLYGHYNRKEFDTPGGTTYEGRWSSVVFDTVDLDYGTASGYYNDTQLFGKAGDRYNIFSFVDVMRCGAD